MGLFDSISNLLGLALVAVMGIAAVLSKLLSREHSRRIEAEHLAREAARKSTQQQAIAEADRKLEAAARETERELVDEVKAGRRDHFESDR